MRLIGSNTSPYVRRIRLMLADMAYEFVTVAVFAQEGQQMIKQYSPTGRIPILIDNENVIWDSLLITQYLSPSPLSLEVQKNLVLINEMNDAGIQLFQLRKFKTDPQDQGEFSRNNLARIKNILNYFEEKNLQDWDIISQWMFCTLDWMDFREVYLWRKGHPKLENFINQNQANHLVKKTDPRIH